jgi:tryptophanyl-tRNA synthetase
MSKSRNTIDLKDNAEIVARTMRGMYAGPRRGAKAPGTVAGNPVFSYLDAFDPDAAHVMGLKGALRAHRREQQRAQGSADNGPE